MALSRNTYALIDDQGNSLFGTDVTVEVRLEVPGQPLTPVPFSDDAATLPLGNPFKVNNGEIALHLPAGRYQIRAYIGDTQTPTFERIWRYQQFGLGGATDAPGVSAAGAWNNATAYQTSNLVEYLGRNFLSNIDNNLNNQPPNADQSDANWTFHQSLQGPQGAPGSSDVVGTSVTSLAPSLGSNVLTIVENARGWGVGARLRAASSANPEGDWFEGVIASYVGNTLNVTADLVSPMLGAGPFNDWTINLAGEFGTLAGYEEGLWTPTLTFVTPGDLSVAYSDQTGFYTRIGRMVIAEYSLQLSTFTHSTAAGILEIHGLPFNSAFTTRGGVASFQGINKANYSALSTQVTAGSSTMRLFMSANALGTSPIQVADVPSGGAPQLPAFLGTHVYQVGP